MFQAVPLMPVCWGALADVLPRDKQDRCLTQGLVQALSDQFNTLIGSSFLLSHPRAPIGQTSLTAERSSTHHVDSTVLAHGRCGLERQRRVNHLEMWHIVGRETNVLDYEAAAAQLSAAGTRVSANPRQLELSCAACCHGPHTPCISPMTAMRQTL